MREVFPVITDEIVAQFLAGSKTARQGSLKVVDENDEPHREFISIHFALQSCTLHADIEWQADSPPSMRILILSFPLAYPLLQLALKL